MIGMTDNNDSVTRLVEIIGHGGIGKVVGVKTAFNDDEKEQSEHLLGIDRILIKNEGVLFTITLGEKGDGKDFGHFMQLSISPKVLDVINRIVAATPKGGGAAVELPEKFDDLYEYDDPDD